MSAEGCRLTLPRVAVLGEVAARGVAFTASELLEAVAAVAPDIGRATVFRTLDLLVGMGLLQRVHTEAHGSWGHLYVLCGLSNIHHHHLVCTQCGQITDFAGCAVEELASRLESETSFQVEGHHLELYGRCERCRGEATE